MNKTANTTNNNNKASRRQQYIEDYQLAHSRLIKTMDAIVCLSELLHNDSNLAANLSGSGRNGLANILDMLNEQGWQGIEFMPMPYRFKELLENMEAGNE